MPLAPHSAARVRMRFAASPSATAGLRIVTSETSPLRGHRLTWCLVWYNICRIMRRARQLELSIRTRGGRRKGAGRKPAPGRRRMTHGRRAPHDPRCPAHVTLRAKAGLPSLRERRSFAAIRGAIGAGSGQSFRLLQFSVQTDHIHLLVEADGPTRLVRGVQGLAIRLAKAINGVLRRRGAVWGDRYHARTLGTPREVRNAFVYVLNNWRKHVPGAQGLDPCSSAASFVGWRNIAASAATATVARARTWLASIGWRRHGLIDIDERPRGAPVRRLRIGLRPAR